MAKGPVRPPDWRTMSHDARVEWLATNDPSSAAYQDRQRAKEAAAAAPVTRSRPAPARSNPPPAAAAPTSSPARDAFSPEDEYDDGNGTNTDQRPAAGAGGADQVGDELRINLSINGYPVSTMSGPELIAAVLRGIADSLTRSDG